MRRSRLRMARRLFDNGDLFDGFALIEWLLRRFGKLRTIKF